MAVGNWADKVMLKLIALWSEDSVQAMLEGCKRIALWSEDSVQAMLEGCKRNKDVYRRAGFNCVVKRLCPSFKGKLRI